MVLEKRLLQDHLQLLLVCCYNYRTSLLWTKMMHVYTQHKHTHTHRHTDTHTHTHTEHNTHTHTHTCSRTVGEIILEKDMEQFCLCVPYLTLTYIADVYTWWADKRTSVLYTTTRDVYVNLKKSSNIELVYWEMRKNYRVLKTYLLSILSTCVCLTQYVQYHTTIWAAVLYHKKRQNTKSNQFSKVLDSYIQEFIIHLLKHLTW